MENRGTRFLSGKRVTDVVLNEATGAVTGVVCGEETFQADAVVFSVGISALQRIVPNRYGVNQLGLFFWLAGESKKLLNVLILLLFSPLPVLF